VKVTAVGQDNREILLSIRVGGDIVGELAAMDYQPRSATVTACSVVYTHRIAGTRFRELVAGSPKIASAALTTVGNRFRVTTRRRVVELGGYPVRIRLFRMLAEMCEGHGRTTRRGRVIGVRLTQADLASAVGASESAVHKALRELRNDGIAECRWGRITVFRPVDLTERAGLTTDS
jgi:CRP-like cAMP-binding protein